MSSSSRTTSKGGKGAKADKSNKSDGGKGGGDKLHNKEQNSKNDDVTMRDKVKQVIEMTCRSEEEVCLALHESNNDVSEAVNMLFEDIATGEWETKDKKKKKRQASTSKQDKKGEEGAGADTWEEEDSQNRGGNAGAGDGKERGGRKDKTSGGPPRLHGRNNEGRGWRGKDRDQNEEGGGRGGDRRGGRGPGGSRGGGGGRGRGGGRAGGRYQPRGGNRGGHSSSRDYNKQPIDTWDNSNAWDNSTAAAANTNHTGADEWSTEEYTGSLVESKVFTPSVPPNLSVIESGQEPNLDPNLTNSVQQDTTAYSQSLSQTYNQTVQMPNQQSPVPPTVNALTPAQSQYFSQLAQQNNDILNKQYSNATYQTQTPYDAKANVQQVYTPATQAYSNTQPNYGNAPSNTYGNNSYQAVANSYGSSQDAPPAQQPTRTKPQRARVPPPSKIPSSAVEMPGDLNSSIGYLDVQFGVMDLIDNSFDSSAPSDVKYGSENTRSASGLDNSSSGPGSGLDLSSTQANASAGLDGYSANKNTNQNSINSTLTQSTTASSYVNPAANYVNNQANSYSNQNPNSYPNSYSTTASYQNANASSTGFPSVTQSSNSYQSSQAYQSQNATPSVYGANSAGLNNSSNFGGTTTSQYNNYSSTTSNHKLGKDNSYDANTSSVSSTTNTTSSNATSASTSLTLTQTTNSNSKSAGSLSKNSTNNVVSNIPPGVTPVMSTPYIMGQVPYFQSVYSYEDMQLLQQRMPHLTTPYYDLGYQTPTTLAAVRGDPAAGLGGYSTISADGRFAAAAAARGDGNTSPVSSSTLAAAAVQSQASTLTAQQGHQGQPILASTGPSYFFAPFNPIPAAPNYAQFGPMYTQLPAVTNAHGSSTTSQYGPKPATYGSASYGAYEALGQSTQDYAKGGYAVGTAAAAAAVAQQAQKAQGNSTTGGSGANDLNAMYSKPHAAIGKVNSYEKQSFHSGTPPPFTGALHSNQNAGLAPSGTGYAPPVYIPAMAPQHHSTMAMHQPLHQMDVRHQGRRVDSGNSAGQRSQGSNQAKTSSKQPYGTSYWNQN
ncbi:ubiquitin-associated protein-like lingerer isoform X16 [Rhynchophorus ferrugineus]|uniref:ubiquitin-associated protein-like lingerer isoform X16 n=1 Tax=Rhynchophorus ferrugineus TaxID=354439 RepID=UPI003FCDA497